MEWTVIRGDKGIRAIEVTTELPEYWETLAGFAPREALRQVGELSQERGVPTEEVFGSLDPFHSETLPAERIAAFRARMLARSDDAFPAETTLSRFNSGDSALCCMIHENNSLSALLELVVSSAVPCLIKDSVTGRARYASGSEAIYASRVIATAHRNSDPLLAERITRWVTEGRLVALDSSPGVYIRGVQRHELTLPDGTPVPEDWFTWSRPMPANPGEPARYQHLRLEATEEAGFSANDLMIPRTGERLLYGAQLAELIQLGLQVRTSGDRMPVDIEPVAQESADLDCGGELASWAEFVEAGTHP